VHVGSRQPPIPSETPQIHGLLEIMNHGLSLTDSVSEENIFVASLKPLTVVLLDDPINSQCDPVSQETVSEPHGHFQISLT